MWIVCTPLSVVGLITVLLLREYSLERTTVKGPKGEPVPVKVPSSEATTVTAADVDPERGLGEELSEKEQARGPEPIQAEVNKVSGTSTP